MRISKSPPALLLVCAMLLVGSGLVVQAYPNFNRVIPNGDKVKFDGESWPGVGHSRVYGGGDLNSFGRDFMRAGNKWTEELCRMDSDEDGRSNGEELGDPNCVWKLGDPHPKAKFVTHPGVADECPTPSPAPSVMKIAVLGSGGVGKALYTAFESAGLNVMYGVRNKETHTAGGNVKSIQEAAQWGTVVILAVPGTVVLDVVKEVQASLKGKVIIDVTNPLTWDKGPVWSPPPLGSLTAEIAALLPGSNVVKAFNTFGVEHMENPMLSGRPAQVFMAGSDEKAKKVVTHLCDKAKFAAVDVGPLRNAAALENLAVLWIHMATVGGRGRDFTFATVSA